MSTTRISEKIKGNGKLKIHDNNIIMKAHFQLFNTYLALHHLPQTMKRFCDTELTLDNDQLAVNHSVRTHCKLLTDMLHWEDLSVEIWDVINLKNLKEHVLRYKDQGNRCQHGLVFLGRLNHKAEILWALIRKHKGVIDHHKGYTLFPRYIQGKDDTTNWSPMHHWLLQKLNEHDIQNLVTHGMKSSCLFVKDHSTCKVEGHCNFKRGNKVQYVKYLYFHLGISPYLNSKDIPRIQAYPNNTFPGHVHGLCVNPYHYHTTKPPQKKKKLHERDKACDEAVSSKRMK